MTESRSIMQDMITDKYFVCHLDKTKLAKQFNEICNKVNPKLKIEVDGRRWSRDIRLLASNDINSVIHIEVEDNDNCISNKDIDDIKDALSENLDNKHFMSVASDEVSGRYYSSSDPYDDTEYEYRSKIFLIVCDCHFDNEDYHKRQVHLGY